MTAIFVTRHAGAMEWARRQGIAADMADHLDVTRVGKDDVVIGTLPIHLVAEVNIRGGEYWHLELDLPKEARGKDLSADEMARYGAKLTKYEARRVGPV